MTNYSTAIFLVRPDSVRAVKCAYELDSESKQPGKLYTFKTHRRDLSPGDIVIVPTDTRVGYTCVQVVELDVEIDLDSNIQFKWIAGKLDKAEYDQIIAAEAEMIATIKRAEIRRKRMELADKLFADQQALKGELEQSIARALPATAQTPGSEGGANGASGA